MAYLRGALVEFMPTGLIPIPNIIVFQYNPESMSHAWTQPEAPTGGPNQTTTNPLAVNGDPGESFTFTLALDAADSIADGVASAGLAKVSGVYSRIAALEMLLYPASATTGGLLGTVTAAIGSVFGAGRGQSGGAGEHAQHGAVRVGAGPHRPGPGHRADDDREALRRAAQPDQRRRADHPAGDSRTTSSSTTTTPLRGLARAANSYTQGLRQALAVANLVNSAESIVGMLPI